MNKIKFAGTPFYSFSLPSSREEIKPKQWRKLGPYLLEDSVSNRSRILGELSHPFNRANATIKAIRKTPDGGDQLGKILELLGFVYKDFELDGNGILESGVHPILSWVRVDGKKRYLPQKNLQDISLEEWATIVLLLSILRNPETSPKQYRQYSRMLIATISRKRADRQTRSSRDWDGSERAPFNEAIMEREAAKIKKITPLALFACLDYAQKGALFLHKKFPGVFRASEGETPNPLGWVNTILSLGESQTFGTEQQVKKVNINIICHYLDKKRIDNRTKKDE